MYDLQSILQFLINGLSVGCIYGLVAIGFSVIFNASGIVNFAQGAFVMLGGIVTYVLYGVAHLPLYVAIPLSILFSVIVAVVFEVLVIKPLWKRNTPVFIMMLATLALSVITENGVLHTVGDQAYSFPPFTAGGPLRFLGAAVGYQTLWMMGASVILLVLLNLLYRHTLIGKAMRACAVNREVASLLGIRVETMLTYGFALSGALGAIAGILITPTQFTAYHVTVPFAVSGFIAAILGGLGNATGAFVGGVLLGVLESFDVLFFDSGYKDIVAFSVLLLVLFFRPSGLFSSLVES